MQTPEYVGSSAARMILALCGFMLTVGAGVWWLTRDHAAAPAAGPTASDKTLSSREVGDAAGGAGPFFYKTIGGQDAPVAPAHETRQDVYTLELKVATSREQAEKYIDDLAAHGIEAYYTPLSRQGQVVYRVRRGAFGSQKEANEAAIALKDAHKTAAKVVKLQ